jgi:hypothetical protein
MRTNHSSIAILLAATLASFAPPVAAQATVTRVTLSPASIVPDEPSVEMDVHDAPAEVAAEAPAEGAPAAEEPKKQRTKRAEKLRGLNFDRRASSILAAMSRPAPVLKEEEAKEEEPPKDEKEAKKRAEAKAKKAEERLVAFEMETLAYKVTIGDWNAVGAYIAELKAVDADDAQTAFDRMITSLAQGPARPPDVMPQGQQYIEKNQFSPVDVMRIAGIASSELKKEHLSTLGTLLRLAIEQGHKPETFVEAWKQRSGSPAFPLDKRRLAKLLVAAGEPAHIEGLLPNLEEAVAANDREALNLLARLALARASKDKGEATRWQEAAWQATLAVLSSGDVDEAEKIEALQRAVELAPALRGELGERWLAESFTTFPQRGREILASIGGAAAKGLQAATNDSEKRGKLLELQLAATKALIEHAPDLAKEWRQELTLLATNWLREAQASQLHDRSKTYGPQVQRDSYGNIFYSYYDYEQQMGGFGNQWGVQAVRTSRVLECRPTGRWVEMVDATLRPRIDYMTASLYLKVGEDLDAFPCIESLARTQPAQAKELADEFLRVWARNNDPNAQNSRRSAFVYSYGFDDRANGIPLTRSKQERNLRKLGELVARLRAADIAVDGPLLAEAFKAAHGKAEVYRIGRMEEIFGALDKLDDETFAALLETMRANLASVWRDAAEQQKAKTKRTKKDVEAEVDDGYEVARGTLERALQLRPDAWRMLAVQAALMHDENEWIASRRKDARYAERRAAAFDVFAKAAASYQASLPPDDPSKERSSVYETWFSAALGASDIRAIDHEKQLAAGEIERIKEALAALGPERSERHVKLFANALANRIGSVSPSVKLRYVRQGLAITGVDRQVRDLQQLADYYGDLVTEIQLRTRIDGDARVGHGGPFGLRVDLRHTKDIERESGGFAKYMTNQNNQMSAFNYGRPPENYRDKFEEAARAALSEHFEVLSVTFNDPKAQSVPDDELGWRVTPYAYLLLKPRGAQVDRVPSLKMDIDFLDISGYVVLPIESSVAPIDAAAPAGAPRPYAAASLVQILDEKEWKDGVVGLELKTTGTGLPGEWSELVEFSHPGFKVAKVEDSGPQVVRFLEDGSGVECERRVAWRLEAEGGAGGDVAFAFAKPRVEVAEDQRFRYDDADLVAADPVLQLRRGVAERGLSWLSWAAILAAAGGLAAWMWTRRSATGEGAPARFPVPERPTAFSVLALLRDIERHGGLAEGERAELRREIAELEREFFAGDAAPARDLGAVAGRWAACAA